MAKVFPMTVLVTILVQHRSLGEYCRFTSTSGSQKKCIFPCRCTDGCDTTTGDCLKGGRCEDGQPSAYRWSGPGCQTGNVAYLKTATQSSDPDTSWSENYPAGRAVDGNTDPHIQNNHCAHPDVDYYQSAWWMVDLEETFNIHRVVIYNRDEQIHRLDKFKLSVGNSSHRNEHAQCAYHNGRVVARGKVNESCRAVGQFLSFRREGETPYATALCEVVVIGHKHISCQRCPAGTGCNDIIGCDACAPGKQQPDCTKDCESRTYGVNCREECGQCKHEEPCDIKTGFCTRGCEMWYTSDICKSFIRNPYFETTNKPSVQDITGSSVLVSWPKAKDITPGLDSHYYYIVWLGRRGGTFNNVSHKQETTGLNSLQSHVTGLSFNTNYSVKIEPFRHQKGMRQSGATTEVVVVKTSCIAPESPTIENVTKTTQNGSVGASIVVTWKRLINSGCDQLIAVGVMYRLQTPNNEQWSYEKAKQVTSTYLAISDLTSDIYEVKVKATNNEGVTSTSKSVIANLLTGPRKNSKMTSGGNGAAVVAGVSVSVIVTIAVIFVVIFIFLRRRRAGQNKSETTNTAICFSTGIQQDDGEENAGFETGLAAGGETNRAAGDGDSAEVTEHEYVNTQQVTRDVPVADIAAHFEVKRRQDGFKSEFEVLKSGIRANCTAAKKPQNKNKNRFQDIIAYDHTRVVLSVDKKQCNYINANYITGYNNNKNAYIACQGPRNTTIEDMWRMVWQVKSNTIVMLANLTENGKEKCSQYWPEKNGRRTWGHFTMESVSEEKVANYVIRQFSLRNEETSEVRRIRQLHFTSWPDRGTPQYAYPLLAFRRKVHSFDRAIRGPLVVHCSAGVGRTGTFMAIDILIQQAAAEGKVDVSQCINQLRAQRMNMVQTLDQYVFVYQAMIESSQATVVPCSTLRQTFAELCRNRQIEQQFERLSALKPLARKIKCAALEPNNVGKNRNIDIIPDDQHRPYLLTPWTGRTNYINAVFVHGYKERNAFIVTQSPMASTVVDLWRMLADHESRTVVMLDDCDVIDDQCAIYWPTKEGTTQQFGPFQVQLVQTFVSATSNITVREFKLTKSARNKETATVLKQFHLTGVWREGASLPSNKTVVLELLGLVEKWQQISGNGPVTVHCSDGASRCGLACAAGYVLEHLKVEQEVDVFHAVQHIRTTRPQLVTDREQYGFLYEIALEYMSQFDEYANFH